ncbi:GlsB/YeaQ/YmgE family stress response membrane protein [Bradyrhizobium diazoefficiens]|uniref:GlsB/YeaQ/YmgE family stress response membrane protein n=1 Tax=Bradyrhizobium diazoefficiens TaxID=1355477 RepID=UPI0034E51D53
MDFSCFGYHPDLESRLTFQEKWVLGIAGAFLATFVGQAIGHYGADQGAGFIMATIGAVVVLFIWHRLVASGVIKG